MRTAKTRSGRIRTSSGPRPARISSKISEVAPPIAKRAVSGEGVARGRVLAALLEQAREPRQRRAVALPRALAHRGHLDHRHPGDVGLGGQQFDQCPQRRRHPVGPGLAAGSLVGAGDVGDEDVDHRVVGLEEAVLLAVEHFVEGLERDTGDLDHVGDRRRLVAFRRRDADHRLAQPLPLGAHRVGLRQPMTRAPPGGRIHLVQPRAVRRALQRPGRGLDSRR